MKALLPCIIAATLSMQAPASPGTYLTAPIGVFCDTYDGALYWGRARIADDHRGQAFLLLNRVCHLSFYAFGENFRADGQIVKWIDAINAVIRIRLPDGRDAYAVIEFDR